MSTSTVSTPTTTPTGRVLARRARRSPEQMERHGRNRKLLEISLGIGVPIALLTLWQIASTQGWIDERLYPAPTTIAEVGWDTLSDGESGLRDDILATLRRVLFGVFAGGGIGVIIGIWLGNIRLVRKALEPTLSALYVVPKLALLPVFMTIFGLGEAPLLAIVAWTVFFYVWIYTMEAVVSIPEGYREAAQALNVGRRRTLTSVIIPAVLPQLFVALRVGVNVSIIMIVAAEFLVGTSGLGYVIFDARRLFNNDEMFVGIVVVSIMGVLLANLVAWIGRRVTPWVAS
ncbi:MAG: nitrate transporter permease [Aeromicrobium sp.]|nr:nitrate transporter permease [Aeromicrobium sp.]